MLSPNALRFRRSARKGPVGAAGGSERACVLRQMARSGGVGKGRERKLPTLDLNHQHMRNGTLRGSDVYRLQKQEAKRQAQWDARRVRPDSEALAPLEKEATPAGTYVVVREYAEDGEFVAMNCDDAKRLKRGGGGKRKAETRDVQDPVTIKKSLDRTRITIRRRILALGADRMLTLTIRENITDLNVAWELYRRFCKSMRERWPDRWAYVCVPEFQERGAVHFHVAIKGFYPVDVVRSLWHKALSPKGKPAKSPGNIDISSPRSGSGARAIAAYLAKYLTKNAVEGVPLNRRRFSAGGDIPEPTITRGYVAPGYPIHRMVRDHFWTEHSKPVAVEYSPEGGYLTYYAT